MYSTQAEKREFVLENVGAYVQGHAKFSLSRQGQIFRQSPEAHELLKQEAAAYIESAQRRVHVLREEVNELEQRLQQKRADLARLEAIAKVKSREQVSA